MNKIPIGNTLQVRWRVKHNGQAESLEGLDLSLVMTHPDGQKQAMAFAVSDTNLVTVNYEGKDQKHTGNYRLDLYENRGVNNQRRIDSTPAFVLVAHTAEAHRESAPNLEVYTVDLTGDIEIGYPSTAVLFVPQELTDEQKAQARENIGVEDEIFVAEYGVTTFAEVKEAYDAGKSIKVVHVQDQSAIEGMLTVVSESGFIFSGYANFGIAHALVVVGLSEVSGWTFHTFVPATSDDLNGKVDKVPGKGLSTNDYTDADKSALAGKLDKNFSPFSGIDISHYSDYDDASFNIERKKNNVKTANISLGSLGVWVTHADGTHGLVATQNQVNSKQDTISDLSDIRSGASAGATALQPTDIADWAKQPTKPTYTASEVGALPSSTEIPSKTSDLTNDSGYIGDAPSGGEQYARKAGEWVKVQGGFYYNEII